MDTDLPSVRSSIWDSGFECRLVHLRPGFDFRSMYPFCVQLEQGHQRRPLHRPINKSSRLRSLGYHTGCDHLVTASTKSLAVATSPVPEDRFERCLRPGFTVRAFPWLRYIRL